MANSALWCCLLSFYRTWSFPRLSNFVLSTNAPWGLKGFPSLYTYIIASFGYLSSVFFKKFHSVLPSPLPRVRGLGLPLGSHFYTATTGLRAVGSLWREGLTRFTWSILSEVAFPLPYTFIIADTAVMSSVFLIFFARE